MFKFINTLILLFYIFANTNAAYVQTDLLLNNYKVKPRSNIYYSNNSYDEKYDVLSKIYNNNPLPCETCGGKFYIVKNETFNKNFSIVRDTIKKFLLKVSFFTI